MPDRELPISVIVLTCNEEKNIKDCLRSVHGRVDEIFIVDSYSTDYTLEIAKKCTDKIYQHKFENYAAQRNWAQEHLPLRNEWVFHLDADERATPELLDELEHSMCNLHDHADGFIVSRKSVFMGRWIKHGGHYPVYHLRIFKKDAGRCEDRLYDQHFYVKGKVRVLSGDIIDTITSDIGIWKSRHRTWAVREAIAEMGRHKEPDSMDEMHIIRGNAGGSPIEKRRALRERYYDLPLFVRPFLYFLYRYIFRLGFLDGREGLIFHFFQGFWFRFLVDIKIHEIMRMGRRTNKKVNDVIYELYGIKVTK